MPSRYAKNTKTSVARSEAEIKRTLLRYGADEIVFGHSVRRGVAFVQFSYRGLPLEAPVNIPPLEDFRNTPTGLDRSEAVTHAEWEKACRQRWRVLLLLIKAKLEAVEDGYKPETEFLGWILLPNGRTFGEAVLPEIRAAISGGKLPKLLPGPDNT